MEIFYAGPVKTRNSSAISTTLVRASRPTKKIRETGTNGGGKTFTGSHLVALLTCMTILLLAFVMLQ